MQKCEGCGHYKRDAFRRAEHGKVVCSDCHQKILRSDSPTGLVRRPLPASYFDLPLSSETRDET